MVESEATAGKPEPGSIGRCRNKTAKRGKARRCRGGGRGKDNGGNKVGRGRIRGAGERDKKRGGRVADVITVAVAVDVARVDNECWKCVVLVICGGSRQCATLGETGGREEGRKGGQWKSSRRQRSRDPVAGGEAVSVVQIGIFEGGVGPG